MRRRPGPARALLGVLWQAPVYAVPIAAFFVLTSGRSLSDFWTFYLVSLTFGLFGLLGVWLSQHWLSPLLLAGRPDDPRLPVWRSLLNGAVAMLFGVAAAVLLNATLVPGFLGSARSVVLLLTYFVLFGMLFVGAALAFSLYRRALERAGSERELQLARRIQKSFLLEEFPCRRRLDVHAVNLSSREVSGDFYDVIPVGDDGYLLVIADVSGKGVPAALLSSMLQASLRTQALPGLSVPSMVGRINDLVCGRAATGQFATLFLAWARESDMTLRFTNAGHNFPILLRADGGSRTLETGGLVVGMMEGAAYEEGTVPLEPGDRLVLYTDGVTEADRGNGDMFGEARLETLLRSLPPGLSAREVVEAVLSRLRLFLGEVEAGDDVTVMALCVRGEGT